MAVKIRLRQQGCRNKRSYRLVVTESQNKRDGKYVEALGWYDPLAKHEDKMMALNAERVLFWLARGAILTESAKFLVAKAAPEIMKQEKEKKAKNKAKSKVKSK